MCVCEYVLRVFVVSLLMSRVRQRHVARYWCHVGLETNAMSTDLMHNTKIPNIKNKNANQLYN